MPIHVVPLVVGGTIAVIGTGYAFKKFVYDPHLAPVVEAIFATRHSSSSYRRLNDPVSVPVHSANRSRASATASGVEQDPGGGVQLRRRNVHVRRSESGNEDEGDLLISPSAPGPVPSIRHDDEIRSIIFNAPPSSAPSRAVEHAPVSPRQEVLVGTGGSAALLSVPAPALAPAPAADPSTTFSFLSLSQASSPETHTAHLDSLSMSMSSASEWGLRPDTAPTFPRSGGGGGLGLDTNTDTFTTEDTGARSVGMAYLSPAGRSVISLSDSDGWDAISDARSA